MRVLALALACLVRVATAIYADEAGVSDYHLALLGYPSLDNTFFHQPVPGSKASLVYTLSYRNVLGAVNPKDGSVVWRQPLLLNKTIPEGRVSTAEGQDVLFTAVNDTASAWSASDGRFHWNVRHDGDFAKDVATLDSDEGRQGKTNGDAVVLWEGKKSTLQRIDANTGSVKWTYEDTSGNVPYRVTASENIVYLVGLSKAMLGGHKLHVTSVDARTGKSTDSLTLSTESDITSEEEILRIGRVGRVPVAIWTDASKSTIKVNVLSSKNIASFDVDSSAESIFIQSASLKNAPAHFLVELRSANAHWAQVYHIDAKADLKKAKVAKVYDLPKIEDAGAFTSSAVGQDLYFIRVSGEVQLFSSASHGMLARWPLKSSPQVGMDVQSFSPAHAAAEVVVRGDQTYAVRSTALLATGDWVLIRNGDVQWSRPEQLSSITMARWLSANKSQALVKDLEVESVTDPVSAFLHRIKRHFVQLSQAPDLISVLPDAVMRWLSSFTQKATSKDHSFGFDTPLEAYLENGDVVAIDAQRPRVVRKLGSWDVRTMKSSSEGAFPDAIGENEHRFKIEDSGLSWRGPTGDMWHFSISKGQEVFKVYTQLSQGRVASIGKVLGDRSVLYKYLNPNAALILTRDESEKRLAVYLMDAVSGSVLHSAEHDDVDFSRSVSAVLAENWFAYTFSFDSKLDTLSRGSLLVMSEAYESELPNDRGPFGLAANFSAVNPSLGTPGSIKPHVISQTYHIPEEISQLAVTRTHQGITSRQLLATLPKSKAIVGIPQQVLDPRRPVGVKATNQQMEEGLMQYSPLIDFDPKIFLTHTEEVLGITHVISEPSNMESTSLVFAWGLDIFGTRVAPSFAFDILGQSFNKIQLVFTVIALMGVVYGVAPLIKRKQTNALWQST